MTSNNERVIAVIGAAGNQGGGVVRALESRGQFKVRALSRNPDKHREIANEVVEVAEADLNKPATLEAAFENAYGVFLVTNFWEQGTDEARMYAAFTWATFTSSAMLSPEHSHIRTKLATASICRSSEIS